MGSDGSPPRELVVSSTRKVAAKPSKRSQQLSFRNKMLRGVVWVFLAVFVLSVVGVAVVTSTAHR